MDRSGAIEPWLKAAAVRASNSRVLTFGYDTSVADYQAWCRRIELELRVDFADIPRLISIERQHGTHAASLIYRASDIDRMNPVGYWN